MQRIDSAYLSASEPTSSGTSECSQWTKICAASERRMVSAHDSLPPRRPTQQSIVCEMMALVGGPVAGVDGLSGVDGNSTAGESGAFATGGAIESAASFASIDAIAAVNCACVICAEESCA